MLWHPIFSIISYRYVASSGLLDKTSPFKNHALLLWKIIPFALLWTHWRVRNERAFNEISTSNGYIIAFIKRRIKDDELASSEERNQ